MYRVVPGLGNLHGRFSFNSNALLIYLLFYRPDYFLSTFTINGLFLLIIAFWTIIYAAQLHKITQTIALLGILVAFFITYISTITSTSTNLLVNILCVYLLLKYIFENKSFTKDYLIYFSLPLLCITLKLSSIFICLLALILIYNIIQKKNYRILNVLLLLSFLIIAPWITRFIITSGYFIYPYPSIDIFNFDWKIPIESVIQEKESIYAWSRLADKSPEVVLSMPLNEWLPIWLSRLHKIEILVYSLSSISILTMLLFIRNINKYKKYFLAWGIAYIGFFFGFLTVPNSTYTLGFITCAAFIPFILLKKTYIIIRIEKYKILQSLAYLFFIIILLNILQHGVKGIIKNQEDSDSYLSLLYKPQPVFKTNQTNINVKEYKIGKTIIYTPIDGDRCFDHCIPCTPYINNSLIMRGETLQNGFKIKK